jgi:hypothetical protein
MIPTHTEPVRAMGLSTYRHLSRTEIEIGTWGTGCAGLLFFASGVLEYFWGEDVTWISGLGCMIGIGTIAAILVRAYISDTTVRARKAFRKLRRG